MDTETGKVTELKTFENHIVEAPNWYQQDDDYLYYNSDGFIYRYCISKDEEIKIESGHCTNCNNDHVISAGGSDDHVILKFFGGQGSVNVNSWNPDSKRFAFVKYRLNHK